MITGGSRGKPEPLPGPPAGTSGFWQMHDPLSEIRDLCREAGLAGQAGQWTHARQLAEKAVQVCRQSLGDDHYSYAFSLATYAWTLEQMGDNAEPLFQQVAGLARNLKAVDFEHARAALTLVLKHYEELHQLSEVARIRAELLLWHREALGEDHPRTRAAAADCLATTPS